MVLVCLIVMIWIWVCIGLVALTIDDYKNLIDDRERMEREIRIERDRAKRYHDQLTRSNDLPIL